MSLENYSEIYIQAKRKGLTTPGKLTKLRLPSAKG